MNDILRLYHPHSCLCGCGGECTPSGRPLNWEICSHCAAGTVTPLDGSAPYTCPFCAGLDSLKAAALAHFSLSLPRNAKKFLPGGPEGASGFRWGDPEFRCEDCAHPMGAVTCVGFDEGAIDVVAAVALEALIEGRKPFTGQKNVFSACDKHCDHGGPGRVRGATSWTDLDDITGPWSESRLTAGVQASWRHVTLRTLGWEHDLRPENLAVLCLRCLAGRASQNRRAADTV